MENADLGLFRTIVQSSNHLFYVCGKEHLITYISPYCQEMFGYNPEEMKLHWMSFATDNPINKEGFSLTELALRTGVAQKPYYLELRKKSGEFFWVEVRESPLKNDEGEVIGMVGSLTDVTLLFSKHEELRRFQLGLEKTNDIVFMTDIDGKFIYVNQAFSRIYGYTLSDLQNQTPRVLKSGKQDEEFYKNFWATLKDGKSISAQFINLSRERKELIMAASVSPIITADGSLVGFLAVERDITEEERIRMQLSESEERMRILAEETGYLIYDYDLLSGKMKLSGAVLSMTGYRAEDFSASAIEWEHMIHADDQEMVLHILNQSKKEGGRFEAEYRLLQKDGNYKWVRNSGIYLTYDATPNRLLGIILDTTKEREIAEEMKNHMRELENTVGLMIDRELRMIELKNHIHELEQKLGK